MQRYEQGHAAAAGLWAAAPGRAAGQGAGAHLLCGTARDGPGLGAAGQVEAWWAAHRAAASVSTGDGGAGLEGDAARQAVCDAMTVPVVILRDRRHRPLRGRGPDRRVRPVPSGPRRSRPGGRSCWPCWSTRSWPTSSRSCPAPAGWPRYCAGTCSARGLNGPPCRWTSASPGQTDDIRIHLRRLVALRDQTCQFPGGCDQPASDCEVHHVTHLADGGISHGPAGARR